MKFRLCVMMFLEIFIWGAWYPVFFSYVPKLGFNWWESQLIFNAFHFSALVAIFFSNQFADRTFAAEKFLAFSHLVAGLAMIGLTFVRGGWATDVGGVHLNLSFFAFFGLILLHTLLYVPTISITNAIAFANLKNPAREFGVVRMWGTIGWIAIQWPFVFILLDWTKVPSMGNMGIFQWLGEALGKSKEGAEYLNASAYTFLASGLGSLALAAFSLTLPHTPPRPSRERLAWLEAMKQLKHVFIAVLFFVTLLDAAVHQSYFFLTPDFLKVGVRVPGNWIQPVMSIGQIAEIGTMAVLGYVLKSLGWRMTMVIGILGHAARFATFAFAGDLPQQYQQPAAIGVIVLHGICYAFFFATLYIFIDEFFPKDARASAQGLFNMLILGVGPFVGNVVCGQLKEEFATAFNSDGSVATFDFRSVFLVPTVTALAAAMILLIFFHPPRKADTDVPT